MPERTCAVLVVEDSESCASMLEMALEDIPGVSVRLVRSGFEALRVLTDRGPAFQTVVTDLNMPCMDGFELIRRIRGDERLSAMAIVVVSADTSPDTPARVAELGVAAYFPKPFSPAEVRRKVEQLLDGTTQ